MCVKNTQRLRTAGAALANICFNLKQDSSSLNKSHRITMENAQKEWDAAVNQFLQLMKDRRTKRDNKRNNTRLAKARGEFKP